MKTESLTDTSGNLCMAGSMLLAFIEPSGLGEYTIKTAIAAVIWLGFHVLRSRLEKKSGTNRKQPRQ